MTSRSSSLTCTICSQRFSQKSSLVRHSKRCSPDAAPSRRRKSCGHCVASKSRCDLQRPACGRCRARGFECGLSTQRDDVDDSRVDSSSISSTTASFSRPNARLSSREDPFNAPSPVSHGRPLASSTPRSQNTAESPMELHGGIVGAPPDPSPELVISETRRQVLLGMASGSPPDCGAVSRHIMNFIIRAMRSWPRLMGSYQTAVLPPMIHKVQLENGLPQPLANCYTLVRMWNGHAEESSSLVRDTIVLEVQKLLGEYLSFGELELLATAQSLLILLIILLFSLSGEHPQPAHHPTDAELLVQAWGVTQALTATGLFLDEEFRDVTPPWKSWAIVAAKRRTILALHHVEWAWSLLHGYPVLTCFELGPLPAPSPGFLWREDDEMRWKERYKEWLRRWPTGSYKMEELFRAGSGDGLGVRGEMWLAEADEFGTMVMAEINVV